MHDSLGRGKEPGPCHSQAPALGSLYLGLDATSLVHVRLKPSTCPRLPVPPKGTPWSAGPAELERGPPRPPPFDSCITQKSLNRHCLPPAQFMERFSTSGTSIARGICDERNFSFNFVSNCKTHNIKFTILTILSVQFSGIRCPHFVCSHPHPPSPGLFHLPTLPLCARYTLTP